MVYNFVPFRWFKKGCCQLQANFCAGSTGYNRLVKLAKEKLWLGEMTVSTRP